MKLIGSYTSPYVRKVHAMLIEKGFPFEFVVEAPWAPDTQIGKTNPLGKVPALITEAGETFIDSSVIAEYLETFNAAPAFLPSDPLERVRVRNLATIADGITDAGVTIFLERKRAAEFQQAGWVERHEQKIQRALDLLETQASQGDTLHPDGYSLADLSTACSLAWLDFRLPDIDWRKGRPALTAQVTHSLTRPSMIATVPKG